MELAPGDTKGVEVKTFLFRGTLDQLLERVNQERDQQTGAAARANTTHGSLTSAVV